jgi:hypothetical protein
VVESKVPPPIIAATPIGIRAAASSQRISVGLLAPESPSPVRGTP